MTRARKPLDPFLVCWRDGVAVTVWSERAQLALELACAIVKRSAANLFTVAPISDGKTRGW